jgi:hypothetical protein
MEGLPASPADEQTLLMVFSFASRVAAGLISYDNRVRSRNHKTRELPGSLMSGPIQPSVAVHLMWLQYYTTAIMNSTQAMFGLLWRERRNLVNRARLMAQTGSPYLKAKYKESR